MGLVSKTYIFAFGGNADPTQVNTDFDTLYTLVNGNIDELNLKPYSVSSKIGTELTIINVKAYPYNAKGDGVTDDTVAIVAAIAALKAAGGGVLYFPAGTFKITGHIVINFNNCQIVGAGIDATTIKVFAWVDGIRVSDNTYPAAAAVIKNIIIENLTIDGNNSGYVNGPDDTYGNGINLNAVDNVVVRNVHVKNPGGQGIVSTYYQVGGAIQQSLVIDSCIVEGGLSGQASIGIEGKTSNSRVTNNTVFSTNNITGIYVSNMGGGAINGKHIVAHNTINGVGVTGGIGIRVEDYQSKVLISDNIITGFNYSIRCSSTTNSTYDYLIATNYCIDWVSYGIILFPMNGTDDSKALIIGNQIKSSVASGTSYGILAAKNAMVCGNRIENGQTGIGTSGNGQFISSNWITAVGYAIDTASSDSVKMIGNYHSTDINMSGTNLVNFGNFGYTTERWTGFYMGTAFYTNGTAAPVAGAHNVGDRVFNTIPSVGQPKGWICTVSGTPGTWVSEGNL